MDSNPREETDKVFYEKVTFIVMGICCYLNEIKLSRYYIKDFKGTKWFLAFQTQFFKQEESTTD